MKVYIVFKIKECGEDEPQVIGVFLRMSKAEQCVKTSSDDFYIQEFKVTI